MSLATRFGPHLVTSQVFYRSPSSLSCALVNLKPLKLLHVLIIPQRVVPRLKDLTKEEVADLFQTAQLIGSVVEQEANADSLTIALQDGVNAGQTVPHVHIHVIPRKAQDYPDNDMIYEALDSDEADLGKAHAAQGSGRRTQWEKVDDADRVARTIEDMEREAKWLSTLF
ncbi:HIT-like protein [Saitoella complicata NRRL Y-17804]|uniref:Bis(5'-adenosyl)-triphosphatase n=1 Tax=Saitoella complicata (strain BCRC 22490 / CBS 7301 / JCM 7358 / NBRC 10748 / NRRL Y-17804) TaxID=698492 RepID=A0A0E9NC44_SAICN|nr:HIT-like protein [Saitoella complicata NRRL Y-17804]ODQ51650.1 HIT-like protein [Saitoella complicata NRRL Y-17804]GAO47399.1 hypothetical protein G7K_1607-t1 [Saitoella complicata NRRL Y-17804]